MAGAVGIEPTLTVLETVVLPLNYAPIRWWLGTESNRRHEDFQSSALPTELPSHFVKMAELTGFEPAVSCVTGRHVRPLHHSSTLWFSDDSEGKVGCGGRI